MTTLKAGLAAPSLFVENLSGGATLSLSDAIGGAIIALSIAAAAIAAAFRLAMILHEVWSR
jgi:hypothetical protein